MREDPRYLAHHGGALRCPHPSGHNFHFAKIDSVLHVGLPPLILLMLSLLVLLLLLVVVVVVVVVLYLLLCLLL